MSTYKSRTTSYYPQSDGMEERFNQTKERYLAKVVENCRGDWDKHIQPFMLSYQSAVHESTSVKPAFANFRRASQLPANLMPHAVQPIMQMTCGTKLMTFISTSDIWANKCLKDEKTV
ncbi:unnamed protein product [Parnassius mnemosyne]|uniref:Integrase catalytic domain-containing protein n=1 Tax=Parnassius mnemosyne TaxID=213953 RepID=A0AAV1LFA2_9NEOP